MEDVLCPGAERGSDLVLDPGSLADPSKRRFLHAAGMLMAGLLVPRAGEAQVPEMQRARGTRSSWSSWAEFAATRLFRPRAWRTFRTCPPIFFPNRSFIVMRATKA